MRRRKVKESKSASLDVGIVYELEWRDAQAEGRAGRRLPA